MKSKAIEVLNSKFDAVLKAIEAGDAAAAWQAYNDARPILVAYSNYRKGEIALESVFSGRQVGKCKIVRRVRENRFDVIHDGGIHGPHDSVGDAVAHAKSMGFAPENIES